MISCIAALSLFAAFMSVNEGHPDLGFGLMAVFVFLGIYVFIATLETTVLRNLVELRASLVAWLAIFSYVAFLAKSNAAIAINDIFHVDASVFPMTLLAVTALQTLGMFFWFVVAISVLLIIVAWLGRDSFSGSKDGVAIIVTIIISAAAQLFFALMIHAWINDEEQSRNSIYRIAHFADFNARHSCKGVASDELVVYTDAQRSKVLIAPKLEERVGWNADKKASWLQPVTIPDEFPQQDCIPLEISRSVEESLPPNLSSEWQ